MSTSKDNSFDNNEKIRYSIRTNTNKEIPT